jgi:hypothetical protein
MSDTATGTVDGEIRYLRDRISKLAEAQGRHGSDIGYAKEEMARLKALLEKCVTTAAMNSAVELVMSEMRSIGKDVELMKRAVFGTAALVLTGVIVAVLALVLRQ